MAQFKNIDDLINSITTDIGSYMATGKSYLQDEIAELMKDAVNTTVYDAYNPVMYERRGEDGGLSDPRNLKLVGMDKLSHKVTRLVFQNITSGNPAYFSGDNLLDNTTETIVNGIQENWDYVGEWAKPRDFVSTLNELIRQRQDLINNAIKRDLKRMGFKVR